MEDYTKDPGYIFDIDTYNNLPANVYRRGDTPNFKVNEELRAAVFQGMPQNLSREEKAIFIYYRLCNLLEYDENFFYQRNIRQKYEQEFSEDAVAKIKPNSKIICGDFSILYYQLLSEIEGVEPVIIEMDNGNLDSHYLVGFYTDRVSMECEGINLTHSNTIGYGNQQYSISANDLARLKSGIIANGLCGIDPGNIIPNIMYNMYVAATGRAPTTNYEEMFFKAQDFYDRDMQDSEGSETLSELLQDFHDAPKTEIPDSVKYFEKKFLAFIKTLKTYGLKENSAYMAFYNLDKISFFGGEQITDTKVGQKEIKDGKEVYRRLVLFQREDTSNIYCFDPKNLSFSRCEREQIEDRLNSGMWMYECDDEKILD